jgi:hypothetical protein
MMNESLSCMEMVEDDEAAIGMVDKEKNRHL